MAAAETLVTYCSHDGCSWRYDGPASKREFYTNLHLNKAHGADVEIDTATIGREVRDFPQPAAKVSVEAEEEPDDEATELPPLPEREPGDTPQQVPVVWRVKVDGTGLRYRSPDEAYVAADEIEYDGERVAEGARRAGNDGKAEQALDAARELAEKIREAATAAENGLQTPEIGHEAKPKRGHGKKWEPEQIIAAIQRWAEERGEPPRAEEWTRKETRARRGTRRPRPSPSTSAAGKKGSRRPGSHRGIEAAVR